jgi:hypothetical protein
VIIAVTGARTYKSALTVNEKLSEVHARNPIEILLTGHCGQGADLYAEDWATLNGVQQIWLPAAWRSVHGMASGFVRNLLLLEVAMGIAKPSMPRLLAFTSRCTLMAPKCTNPQIHMTHGTADCIRKAKDLPIRIHRYPDETLI